MFYSHISFPVPRFKEMREIVYDNLTRLFWTKKADLGQGLVTWNEAFEIIKDPQVQASTTPFGTWPFIFIREL